MEISRNELYERVWATPIFRLAKEFGVSDVGLSKACRRHAIPTPAPGHWTRVEHGKGTPRPPLPPSALGETVSVSLERSSAQRLPVVAPVHLAVQVQAAGSVQTLEPFAKATLAALSKARPLESGLIAVGGGAHYRCVVSPAQAERAVLILDAIERKLPELGGHVLKGDDKRALVVDFNGQHVNFALTERYLRTQFIPESQRSSPYPLKQYSYAPTGELKLAIEGYFEGRKTWSDGSRAKLEEKLPELLAGLSAAAEAMRKIQEQRDEQRRQWDERDRIRREREEIARRRASFRDAFAAEADGWQRHLAAAQYLAHLRQTLRAEAELPAHSVEWLNLAEQAVADLDPTAQRVRLLEVGVEPASHVARFGPRLVEDKRSVPNLYGPYGTL